MVHATTRWMLSLGFVIAALLAIGSWRLLTKSKRLGIQAASAEIVGSEADDACAVVAPWEADGSERFESTRPGAIPEMDRHQPTDYETATFAMG